MADEATRQGGRPSKRTPEVEKKLLDAIAAGNYYEAACAYAGVTYETFNEWRKTFPEFSDAVRAAEGRAEVAIVALWRKHAPDNWQACRDFLARRYPDRWGPHEKHQISGDAASPLVVALTVTVVDDRDG